MAPTLVQANAYFDTRLHAEAWDSASASDRNKAIATADREISALLRYHANASAPVPIYNEAVCEQALWLLRNTEGDLKLIRAIAQGVTSRRVGDAGETYNEQKALKTGGMDISPQAMLLLQPFLLRRTGGIR